MIEYKQKKYRTGTVYLPEDVILDILSRLSPKSLLCFKSVCKQWRVLISDSSFIKLHLDRGIELDSLNLLLASNNLPSKRSRLYGIQGNNLLGQAIDVGVSIRYSQLIGACNGLACYKNSNNNICLLNPSTREYKEIFTDNVDGSYHGAFDYRKGHDSCVYGFGYDSAMDDYVYVRVLRFRSGQGSLVCVYSLKHSLCLKRFDMPLISFYRECPAVYLGGSLHWIAVLSHTGPNRSWEKVMVTFDIAEKVIGQVSLPWGRRLGSVLNAESSEPYLSMGILQRKLCILCHTYSGSYEIWVMKTNGAAENSWSLLYSNDRDGLRSMQEPMRLLYVFKNGEILVNKGTKLVIYDPKENTVKDIQIQGIQDGHRLHTVMTHVPSLVPLNSGTYLGLADESATSKGLVTKRAQ